MGGKLIKENLEIINEQIDEACKKSGRGKREVTLVAVSKKQPESKILEAINCGVVNFGENYVQEWQQKAADLAGQNIQWHFIGHIQSNKIKFLTNKVELIHSIDSLNQLKELSKHAINTQKVLIQVNLFREESKSGVFVEDMPLLLQKAQALSRVQLQGLMFMPPLAESPEASRSFFAKAKELSEKLKSEISGPHELRHLSMGTSQDFIVAIEEGATLIRVGQTLMGQRD